MTHAQTGGLLAEVVWMCEEVGVHFQQRPPLQDEGGQHNLGQIHADTHLGQEVADDAPVLFHGTHCTGHGLTFTAYPYLCTKSIKRI